MKKNLVVIGSLDENVGLIQHAKERGCRVIVIDGYENGPGKKIADKSYDINIKEVDKIAEICKTEGAEAIIGSFSDIIFEQIVKIADKAGLKWYVKPADLEQYRNKFEQKTLFEKNDIKTPRAISIKKDFTNNELSGIKFPVVIKPFDGYGSKGVFYCRNIEEIRAKFDESLALSVDSRDEILVEEYIKGHEYNFQSWIHGDKVYVLGIADRDRNKIDGNTIEIVNRLVYPAHNMDQIYDRCIEIVKKFAHATDQKEGAVSMQFWYTETGEIYVGEIAGRLLGYEHELIKIAGGIDIEELLLDYALDGDIKTRLENSTPFFNQVAAGIYFHAIHGAKIENMDAAYELEKMPYVKESMQFYKSGEIADNFSAKSYFARYYITADTRKEVDDMTKEMFAKMRIVDENGESAIRRMDFEEY